MFNIFKRKKKKDHKTKSFRVEELDFTKDKVSHVLDTILEDKYVGFKLSKVFSDKEIEELDQFQAKLPYAETWSNSFFEWPNSVVQYLQGTKIENNTLEQREVERQQLHDLLEEKISFNLDKRIRSLLSDLSNNRPVVDRKLKEGVYSSPFIFRYGRKGSRGTPVHCENLNIAFFDEKNIVSGRKVLELNCFSYFIVLRGSDTDGLIVYDMEFDEARRLDLSTFNWSNVSHKNIKLRQGDMFIFAAGEILHKVRPIEADKGRFTFGSFISLSPKNELELWV